MGVERSLDLRTGSLADFLGPRFMAGDSSSVPAGSEKVLTLPALGNTRNENSSIHNCGRPSRTGHGIL